MSATTILFMILGGIALTLYGVQQVRDGVMQALGAQLRSMIERSTKRRLQAFAAGIAVTGLIQSATATALIVSSFAARGLIPVAAASAVMLGADVGTSLAAQIFSFGTSELGPLFVFVGMLLVTWFPLNRLKHAGTAIVGLGLMLLGLGTITHAAHPMEESEIIRTIVKSLSDDLPMAFIIGVLFTWLAQSSLAIVLLVMSFAAAGAVQIDAAFALVLGSHVGATISPLLINLKNRDESRQVMWGSFLMRFSFSAVLLPLLDMVAQHATFFGDVPARQVVNFHTAFSIVRALIFLPLLTPLSNGLKRAFPIMVNKNDPSQPLYLDKRDLATPSIALSAATRESLRLGDLVLKMLADVKYIFEHNSQRAQQALMDDDNHVDRLYEQIKLYLAQLASEKMDATQAKIHIDILMFIINLEHIGDIVVKNMCELAQKKWRNNLSFSKQGWTEISNYHAAVSENFRLALNVFQTRDPALARQLVRQKEALQRETVTASGSHFERLRQGLLESLGSSSVHLDVIRDLRRINDHLTSVAYAILEEAGVLQSRIRAEDTKRPDDNQALLL